MSPSSSDAANGPFLSIFGKKDADYTNLIQTFADSKKVNSKDLTTALTYVIVADAHFVNDKFNLTNVQSLVNNGADVNNRDERGLTILDRVETSCAELKGDNHSTELQTCQQIDSFLKSKGAYTRNSATGLKVQAGQTLDHLTNFLKNCF